jgi:hypothetical protein
MVESHFAAPVQKRIDELHANSLGETNRRKIRRLNRCQNCAARVPIRIDDGQGCFNGEAPSLIRRRYSPADFHVLSTRNEAAESYEFRSLSDFHCPLTEPGLRQNPFVLLDKFLATRSSPEGSRPDEFHDVFVGADFKERLKIIGAPATEIQPRGLHRDRKKVVRKVSKSATISPGSAGA